MWKPSGPRAESCSALHVTPGREEEEEGGFTSLYPHHLLYLKHESTLGCTTAAPKVPIPMPAYPFELFFSQGNTTRVITPSPQAHQVL